MLEHAPLLCNSLTGMEQAASEKIYLLMALLDRVPQTPRQAVTQPAQPHYQPGTIRTNRRSSGGWRCGSQIRHEICDRKVGLMANAAHHGDRARCNSPRHDFLVKAPQVLDGAAASAENQDVTFAPDTCHFQRRHDLRSAALTLYLSRINHNPHTWH